MNKRYNSIYGSRVEQFIAMKNKLGYKYATGKVILAQIDRLAEKREEMTIGFTKEFATKWGEKRPNESELYRYERIRYFIQFSSYLRDLGIDSHIPRLPPYPKNTFIPYIYSQKQISEIFKSLDNLRLKNTNPNSCLICIPALIRLLYGTGLRMGEALALKDEDVNLDEHYLRVRDSKNGKERVIPISASLASVCKEYKKYRDQLPLGETKSSYFFINANGRKCGQSVRSWFKKCLDKTSIQIIDQEQTPRLHDLRHTFAVTSLAVMAESGIDLYASLPILSNYLGHQSLGATDHYVRLTSNMYPDLLKNVNMIYLNVFPKFKNDEAD